MISQIIYWKSVCSDCRGNGRKKAGFDKHSSEEIAAFARALRRLRGLQFIRYR